MWTKRAAHLLAGFKTSSVCVFSKELGSSVVPGEVVRFCLLWTRLPDLASRSNREEAISNRWAKEEEKKEYILHGQKSFQRDYITRGVVGAHTSLTAAVVI